MNDLLKASKRVLKTLSQLNLGDYPPPLQGGLNDEIEDLFEAIKKAENQKSMALEEFIQTYQKGYREGKEDALAQPEQELVAWRDYVEQRLLTWKQSFVNQSGDQLALDDFMDKRSLDDLIDFVCDEYTAPPKREWVGLTDEQRHEFVRNYGWDVISKLALVKAIEAKLKEKNT